MSTAIAAERQTGLTAEELRRYSRHVIMPQVGLEGQRKLKAASILLIGVGGLGSPLALYLAAAGLGRIGLVDYDVVDESNLQRQVIHTTADVGRSKLDSARDSILAINPHVEVELHRASLTSQNALEIIAPYDLVVDGTDNFPTRYLTNDACVLLGKPNIYGSVMQFEGQVSVFDARRGPCYRCLYPTPPAPGTVPNCAEGGVFGVLPGTIGLLQATEAIKLILGIGKPLIGEMLLYSALDMSFIRLRLRKRADCLVCGEQPTVTALIDYEQFCGVPAHDHPAAADLPQLTPGRLSERLAAGERLALVDVREPYEWEIANLGVWGAVLIPKGEVARRLGELDPSAETVVYCRSGGRSAEIVRLLRQRGFAKVWNLEGGINAWAGAVDPSMAQY